MSRIFVPPDFLMLNPLCWSSVLSYRWLLFKFSFLRFSPYLQVASEASILLLKIDGLLFLFLFFLSFILSNILKASAIYLLSSVTILQCILEAIILTILEKLLDLNALLINSLCIVFPHVSHEIHHCTGVPVL